MNTKDTIHSQLEHLQMKYVGTGHSDTNKHEWAVNIQRDSYASFVGHTPMIHFFSCAQNKANNRVKFELLQKMMCPAGPPPATGDQEGEEDSD